MNENPLSINDIKAAFYSLKTKKCARFDEINFNVVKKCFGNSMGKLINLMNHIINGSRYFPRKNENSKNLTTLVEYCRLIFVFPFFSKILERIIYNRLYKYL